MSTPIGRLFWEGSEFDEERGEIVTNLLAIDRDNNQKKFAIRIYPYTINTRKSLIKGLCEGIRTRRWEKDDLLNIELCVFARGMMGASDIENHSILLNDDGVLVFRYVRHFKWAPNETYTKTTNVDLSDCDGGELERIAIRLRNALRDPRETSIEDDQGDNPDDVPPTEPLSLGDAAPSQAMPTLEW